MSMLPIPPMFQREKVALEKRTALRVEGNLLFCLGIGFSGVFFMKILGIAPMNPPLVNETVVFGIGAAVCFAASFLASLMRRRLKD